MGKPYTEAVFDSTANPLNFVIQAIEHTFQILNLIMYQLLK